MYVVSVILRPTAATGDSAGDRGGVGPNLLRPMHLVVVVPDRDELLGRGPRSALVFGYLRFTPYLAGFNCSPLLIIRASTG